MHSTYWKLLTAVGIVGIGTLVVLEVQHRLPTTPHGNADTASSSAADPAGLNAALASGESTVTPDDTTDFDRLMNSSGQFAGLSEPSQFDSDGGPGTPAPPAIDDQFFSPDTVDQTVRKDQIAGGENPFAADGDSVPVRTVSESGAPAGEQPDPAVGNQGLEIPLPPDDSAPGRGGETPAAAPAADSDSPAMLFFNPTGDPPADGASGDKSAGSVPASTASAKTASPTSETGLSPETSSVNEDRPNFELDGSAIDANADAVKTASATTSAGSAETRGNIQQTTFSQDDSDEPTLFLPDPVPDVSRPQDRSQPDSSRTFDSGGGTSARGREAPAGRGVDVTLPSFDEPEFVEPPAEPARSSTPGTFQPDPIPFPAAEPASSSGTPRSNPNGRDEFEPIDLDAAPGRTTPAASGSRLAPEDGDLSSNPFGGPGDELSGDDQGVPLPQAGTSARPAASQSPVSETMRPHLTVQKRAPDRATVGVPHEYTIIVTNEGDSPAMDVVVEDELGSAAEVVSSRPAAEFDRDSGKLIWEITELAARERREIKVRITPTGEGTLDGVATVRFKAQVKSATIITAPRLTVEATGPEEVRVGDEVALRFVIRNDGTADASNVILRSVLPPGLKHPEGVDLEYEISLLPAGGRETVDLTVVAAEPGDRIRINSELSTAGTAVSTTSTDISIVGAQLTIQRLGPERRYVGRTARFQNIVTNDTNFDATDAVVVESIPDGMKFVSAGADGQYNPDRREVRWEIPVVAAGRQQVLEIELEASAAGQMESLIEVIESAGFRSQAEDNTVVTVEDFHNVTANISRQDEPVAIGERFGFTITVENRGTADARNVQLAIEIPEEIKPLAAGTREVPGDLVRGNIVRFARVERIAPQDKMTFQVTLQGQVAVRNARVQAFLKCDEMAKELIVSESITVFDDRP
jgi:uncharacterized repeat protein (TIGR01451 family)